MKVAIFSERPKTVLLSKRKVPLIHQKVKKLNHYFAFFMLFFIYSEHFILYFSYCFKTFLENLITFIFNFS